MKKLLMILLTLLFAAKVSASYPVSYPVYYSVPMYYPVPIKQCEKCNILDLQAKLDDFLENKESHIKNRMKNVIEWERWDYRLGMGFGSFCLGVGALGLCAAWKESISPCHRFQSIRTGMLATGFALIGYYCLPTAKNYGTHTEVDIRKSFDTEMLALKKRLEEARKLQNLNSNGKKAGETL